MYLSHKSQWKTLYDFYRNFDFYRNQQISRFFVGCVWSLGLTRLDWVSDSRQTVLVWPSTESITLFFGHILFFFFTFESRVVTLSNSTSVTQMPLPVSFNGKIAIGDVLLAKKEKSHLYGNVFWYKNLFYFSTLYPYFSWWSPFAN